MGTFYKISTFVFIMGLVGLNYLSAQITQIDGKGYELFSPGLWQEMTAIGNEHSCGTANVHNDAITYSILIDQEGNQYRTIVIGGKEWMAENLNTALYRNGDPISHITDNTQWSNQTEGAWAYYGNNSANECPYGKLYNWYAVDDDRGLCPQGWRVATDADWTDLTDLLGGLTEAGGKLKSTGISQSGTGLWFQPNTDATNETGFSAIPGGFRNSNGTFSNVVVVGYWWTATETTNPLTAWLRTARFDNAAISRSTNFKEFGFSVRCVKE